MTEKTSITSLDGVTTGRYVVTTLNGTRHYLDLDERTAVRHGTPGHEWGDQLLIANPEAVLSGSNPKIAAHYEPITRDGKPFRFAMIQDVTVGKCMRLDNRDEWRLTSQIQSIEEWTDV